MYVALAFGLVLLLASPAGHSGFGPGVADAQTEITAAELERASGSRTIRLRALSGGRVATMPLEEYVAEVLAGEGEPGAPDVTQQALAIVVRTFAVVNAGRHVRDGYDLCDTTHCQVIRAATPATRRAARATAGRVLTYNGEPAEVFYSASCGGRSESAADIWSGGAKLPYLQSVEDDVHGDESEWTLDRTLREVQRALERGGIDAGRLRDVQVDGRTRSGRVARVRLVGVDPDTITGDQFRAALGARELRSTAFSLSRDGNRLRFTGRGYGHGVGLCVIGAGRRAARGETVEAILGLYFPGLLLARLGGSKSVDSAATAVPLSVRSPLEASESAPRSARTVTARVPAGSLVSAVELERLGESARTSLSGQLGTSVAPVTIALHETLDDFRRATGKPWWVSAVASGVLIDLAPAAVLAQREGLEPVLRTAMAELLMGPALLDRPAWVRVGAARYFARPEPRGVREPSVRCPSDGELMRAVSAVSQREAEARAEACFARAYAKTRDWRAVR